MAARFAGKYEILDQEVKLGLQILSAVEAATQRQVKIYCLPLSALQIELPCPPEFIEGRFRSAVTLDGKVLEADVDPETENAYVVLAAPGAQQAAGFSAPTMEFNAWRASATHPPGSAAAASANSQAVNSEGVTMERPAWPANEAKPAAADEKRAAEPAVSFTKLFAEAPASPPPTPVAAAPAAPPEAAVPARKMESFTAFFKMPSSGVPARAPEPVIPAPKIDSPSAAPQGGGFTAFFTASKAGAPPEPRLDSAQPPVAAFGAAAPAQPAAGAFTHLFASSPAPASGGANVAIPEANFESAAPIEAPRSEQAPGSFTALFREKPAGGAALEPNFAAPQTAKAPGAFTELFRRTPDLPASPSPSPAVSAPATPPAPAAARKGDGFTAIFGTPAGSPSAGPATPPVSAGPATSQAPVPDLAPKLDRPGSTTQFGTVPASPAQPAAPPAPAGPSQYTMVRKGWTA
ncbi:MAG TPA: hypothetical protein VE998_02195, partial [Terriglobales bacterium]|nr:hypothetical protein [Terriglobales bacterium]